MNAKQLFFERYRGYLEYPARVLVGVTDQQARRSPHPALNPIIWLLWHTARCEDVAVNRLISDREQILIAESWAARLGVTALHFGTGMTKAEVGEICARLDLTDLMAYRTVVARQTEQVIEALGSSDLNRELTRDVLRRVLVDEGAGGSVAESIVEAYSGHTKGWLLGHLALTHNYYHIGQAFAVRALYCLANPW
jgi:hypothetical protein